MEMPRCPKCHTLLELEIIYPMQGKWYCPYCGYIPTFTYSNTTKGSEVHSNVQVSSTSGLVCNKTYEA